MCVASVGDGKIVANEESFTVTAPNGEEFKGTALCESRDRLIEWWPKNGGSGSQSVFRAVIKSIIGKLTPHSCG